MIKSFSDKKDVKIFTKTMLMSLLISIYNKQHMFPKLLCLFFALNKDKSIFYDKQYLLKKLLIISTYALTILCLKIQQIIN